MSNETAPSQQLATGYQQLEELPFFCDADTEAAQPAGTKRETVKRFLPGGEA
ncbi:MAG: hypothetical protein R3B84_08675 [Zavarzinella sp.]